MIINYAIFLFLLSTSYLLATFDEHTGPAALSMIADSKTKEALKNAISNDLQKLVTHLIADVQANKPLPRILLNGQKSARYAALALVSALNMRYSLIKETNDLDLSQTLNQLSDSMKQEPLAIIIYPNDRLIKNKQEKDLLISFANAMPTNCILIGVDPNIKTLPNYIKKIFLNTKFPNAYETQLTVQSTKEFTYYYFLHVLLQNIEFVFTREKDSTPRNIERVCCDTGSKNLDCWCCSAGMLMQNECKEHSAITTHMGQEKIAKIDELFKPHFFSIDEIVEMLRSNTERKSIYQINTSSDSCFCCFCCWPFCIDRKEVWALAKDNCKCHETQYSSCVTIDLDALAQKIQLIVKQKNTLGMNSKKEEVILNAMNNQEQTKESDNDDIQIHFDVSPIEVPEIPENNSFRYKLWKFFGC